MSQLVFWVVQPDPAVAKRWQYLFTREGWGVELEKEFEPFCARAAQTRLGLALVDSAALPQGAESLRRVKKGAPGLSLILTSPGVLEPEEVIAFLEAGADDHFLDNLDDRLLLAKLKAHLRRTLPSMASALDVLKSPDGGLKLDRSCQQVWAKDGRAKWTPLKDLTPTEFRILALFLEQPNRVFDRRDIVESVWQGEGGEIRPGTVDKHIESLRRKLGRLGSRVRTVYGVGYGYRED